MLSQNSYGKSRVRLTKITRHPNRHDLHEFDVSMELEGDFSASYTAGDNRQVIATDSMKNTVYVLARKHPLSTCEDFALLLARHFVERYPQVSVARVEIAQATWQRIAVAGRPHSHSFTSGGTERRTARAQAVCGEQVELYGGFTDLNVLKTTDSEFTGFVSDEFRSLPDASDRIFATSITAEWRYGMMEADWDRQYAAARTAILETFATHYSLAVQQTLLAMGEAVLAAAESVERVTLSLPNQHRIPFNLTPFGLDNPNMIFVTTSEPFGLIRGTIERE